MSSKLMSFAVFFVATAVACGTKHAKNYYPEYRAPIDANVPADIVGSWKQCKDKSGAIHAFSADGSYVMTPVQFATDDCQDAGTAGLPFTGRYVAGNSNELDITMKTGLDSEETLYRIFLVKGNTLVISNTLNAGLDADHRDYKLDADTTLHLTRVP